ISKFMFGNVMALETTFAGSGLQPEPNVLYFQSSLLLTEQMTNKFKIPNRDFGIWNFTAVHSPIIRINS
ncbi:MAG: hypothetical protein NUV76_11890, partial [Candidatus Kuenenia sp.]|nr:hypothetical protein [Candidatus Kuenenia sp.]